MGYPMICMEETGRRIKEAVRARGLTTGEVASYMGFRHHKSVYAWYRGAALPTLENMIALSSLLQIPVNDLIVLE